MLRIAFNILILIKSKLLFAFLIMGLLVAAVGAQAYKGISDVGDVVTQTYDRPLMAINFSRSASQVFSRLDNAVLTQTMRLDTGEDADFQKIESLIADFESDMDIVAERSISIDAEPYIEETRLLTRDWTAEALNVETLRDKARLSELQDKTDKIFTNLDIIVELQANESFLSRENALKTVDRIGQYNIWVAIAALAMAVLLAIWLSLTILRPLRTAVDVAQKVSSGNFDAVIPQGRLDETGYLLKSMTVMQSSIRNLLARERNEKTMAQGHLTAALANSKDAVLIANAQGIITVANAQIKTMFPLIDPQFLIGQPLVKFFNYDGHPVGMSVETFANVTGMNEMRFQDGRWTLLNASDMQEGGRLFIWTDITELKQREVTLRQAKEKAEAANHAKTMFLASMSHELRTPLNAIIGFSDVMKKQVLGPIENDKYLELTNHIYRSGYDLLNMVEDVLVVSGTENKTAEKLIFTSTDICTLIEAELSRIKANCAKRSISVIWKKPPLPCFTSCDQIRFSRIIQSVLSNAVRFNKDGGFIKVQLTELAENKMALDISDTGIGIAQNNIEKIMAPFVQVDNSHSRSYDGAGLGLSIARRYMQLHGGKLSMLSKLGQGTVVRLTFNRDIKAMETSQPVQSNHGNPLRKSA